MKRIWIPLALLALAAAGCGKGKGAAGSGDPWAGTPERVPQGIMHAYETRDDSLYASLLAPDFHYYFEPQGADTSDILVWGKEEEVVATGNLFRTQDVDTLLYVLDAGTPHPATGAGHEGWMVVPISGGELEVVVQNKDPMKVQLNRQELWVREITDPATGAKRWVVEQWHDYPAPQEDAVPAQGNGMKGSSGGE